MGKQETSSQPGIPCSKAEVEHAEATGMEAEAGTVAHQGIDGEIGQEEGQEITTGEEAEGNSQDRGDECAETGITTNPAPEGAEAETLIGEAEESLDPEDAGGEPSEQTSDAEIPPDPNANGVIYRPAWSAEDQQMAVESTAATESGNRIPHPATVEVSKTFHQRSIDPDPLWVLKLLKKAFMAHCTSAMHDLKEKWNLPNTKELDLMITEFQEEVSRKLEETIEKESRKIESHRDRKGPRPLNEEPRHGSSLQAERRRRCLQSMRKKSLFNDHVTEQRKQPETRDFSDDLDGGFVSSRMVSEQPSEEEYCPCVACVKRKMASKPTQSAMAAMSRAPIGKAFDLRQILRMQKGDEVGPRTTNNDITEESQDVDAAAGDQGEGEQNREMTQLNEEGKRKELKEQKEEETDGVGTETLTNREALDDKQNGQEVGPKDEEVEAREAKRESGVSEKKGSGAKEDMGMGEEKEEVVDEENEGKEEEREGKEVEEVGKGQEKMKEEEEDGKEGGGGDQCR